MAKTAKVKKRQITVHSRAARRAASPSIDLDKKLKQTTRDSTSPSRPSQAKPHVLAAQDAGIQKKQKKGSMSRAQRLRHQKGLERAADVLDKRQVKVVKSLGKERTIKERSKGWEDVNGDGRKKKKITGVQDVGEDDVDNEEDREWVSDQDMDDTDTAVQQALAAQDGEVKAEHVPLDATIPAGIPLPLVEDDLL